MKQLLILLALVPTAVDIGQKAMCLKPTAPKPIVKVDMKQIKCLAVMIYGEARGESMLGQVAVAFTSVNRAVKKTLCQVVLQPYQYSVFNNNPTLRSIATSLHLIPKQKNDIDKQGWEMAMKVAHQVAHRMVPDPTNGSTFYLADKVMKSKGYRYPKWSKQYKMVAVIDNHKFYKPTEKIVDKSLVLL
jgi:spore germination cell wall hydrolase CwlJ-like protein